MFKFMNLLGGNNLTRMFLYPEGDQGNPAADDSTANPTDEKKFSQAEVDAIVQARLERHNKQAPADKTPAQKDEPVVNLTADAQARVNQLLVNDAVSQATINIQKEFGKDTIDLIRKELVDGVEGAYKNGSQDPAEYEAQMRTIVQKQMVSGSDEFKTAMAQRILGDKVSLKDIISKKTDDQTDPAVEAAKQLANKESVKHVDGGTTPADTNTDKAPAKSVSDLKARMKARLASAK